MAPRAFLFDLDGTLWRGHEWYATALSELAACDRNVALSQLAGGASVFNLADVYAVSRARIISQCVRSLDSLRLYDGIFEGLGRLVDAGCKLGIVTSLSRRLAEPALNHLAIANFFRHAEFAAKKPSPRPLLAALAALGEDGDRRHYYVGDMPNDALCAAKAGVSFAWASYGYGTAPGSEAFVLTQFEDVVALCG